MIPHVYIGLSCSIFHTLVQETVEQICYHAPFAFVYKLLYMWIPVHVYSNYSAYTDYVGRSFTFCWVTMPCLISMKTGGNFDTLPESDFAGLV